MTGYRLERCQGAELHQLRPDRDAQSGTSLQGHPVSASTSYSYRVRATDAAGNLGSYSNTATATTPAGAVGVGGGVWV